MSEKISACPACKSEDFKKIATEEHQNKHYEISECTGCGLYFTSSQDSDANQGYLNYDEDSFMKKYGAIVRGEILHDRNKNYIEEVKIIKKYLSSGNVLDIGCNAGWLLSYLKKMSNFNLYGLEPSPFLSRFTANRLGIKVYNRYLEPNVLEDNCFDFISMTDVFEHVSNPNNILQLSRRALKDGGHLMIKVPNGAFTFLKYRLGKITPFMLEKKDPFDAKEHLAHYKKKTLLDLIKKNGFRVSEVRVPLPVQMRGSHVRTRLARCAFFNLSRLGLLPPQDLLVIAQRF